jgi:copper chaperone CopZ
MPPVTSLRIEVPVIKGSGVNAATIKGALEQLSGVDYVQANATTGDVLVFFEPYRLTEQEIIDRLRELNAFQRTAIWRSRGSRRTGGRIAGTLLQSAAQLVLRQVIPAFA